VFSPLAAGTNDDFQSLEQATKKRENVAPAIAARCGCLQGGGKRSHWAPFQNGRWRVFFSVNEE